MSHGVQARSVSKWGDKIPNLLEMFTGNVAVHSKVLVHVNKSGGDQTEEHTKTKDNQVANSFRERRLSSKEGVLALVPGKGRDFHIGLD